MQTLTYILINIDLTRQIQCGTPDDFYLETFHRLGNSFSLSEELPVSLTMGELFSAQSRGLPPAADTSPMGMEMQNLLLYQSTTRHRIAALSPVSVSSFRK